MLEKGRLLELMQQLFVDITLDSSLSLGWSRVTKEVPDYALVVGNPARHRWVDE
jgi:hypothetical protein